MAFLFVYLKKKLKWRDLMMSKKQKEKGLIELKQEELKAIQEQIDENALQCQAVWEERNNCLKAGELLKAKDLEGKYYYLRDVVGEQLDRKRIDIDKELEELQAEANRLKAKLVTDARILERQNKELEEIKEEYKNRLADKQQAIENTKCILEESRKRLLELEGGK
jgi:Ser-tRNA(Ala) deacylase AlaX